MFNLNQSKTSFYLLLLCSLFTHTLFAQDSFRYQAVARDSMGTTIANQLIGVQISIVQIEDHLPAIYQEVHQISSNDYGVINLNIGDGVALLGDFATIDWSQKSFLKVEMDMDGGTQYSLNSLSEILSVPKAVYAERARFVEGGQFGLYVTEFGAKGDGVTDDTDAFKTALDSAAILGCKVFVRNGIYKINSTLEIKNGVSLIGEGSGSTPLETPYNGSLIWYTGSDFAVKITGHSSKVKDLVIKDKSENGAAGGLLLQANGQLVESVYLSEILVSGFTEGVGLKVEAINSGGVAYGSFNNVRVRHGKVGIYITQDEGSFVNSNTWNHCQVSGGGFRNGLLVAGGNNNIFNGLIIEPPTSTHGHILVTEGEIFGSEIRIEGVDQPESVPIIKFNRQTKNSIITGVYAGGLTLDKGNNFINMRSGKAIHYKNSSFNKFRNAVFFSPDGSTITDWVTSGTGVTTSVEEPELSEKHYVLKINVPPGEKCLFEPEALARPVVKDLPLYDQVNFGFHIKTDQPETVYTYTNSTKGWTRSTYHSGSGEWEFVGMNAEVNRNQPSRFGVRIVNKTASTIEVYISTPTLNFGNQVPTIDEQPLFTSGGQLNGLLIHAVAEVSIPNNGFLTLALTANFFEVKNTNPIYRINHLTANRFPKGSIITLLFDQAGVNVSNSGYLLLKSGFTSVANGSLTLMSNGNGTWREVNRNN